ncbi:MAG: hypothetical protein VZR54_03760 [Ruminococcus sp.]|nr:hypothetical protein [Ruminococcus sp.]
MKTNRKKMLLSSIAMLLVALVALGSATYAWFTINREVEAKAMNVTAATAKGLEITIDNAANWGRTKSYKAFATATDSTLAPVSFQYTATALQGTGYYPSDVSTSGALTSATLNTASNWNDVTLPTAQATTLDNTDAKKSNGSVAAYRMGIRSSSEAISDVTMTLTYADDGDTGAGEFIRFAVVDENDSNKVVAGIADGAASTYPIKKTGSTYSVDTTAQVALSNSKTGITAPAKTSAVQYYTVYVWFEGQDSQCNDAHQGLTGNLDIKFSF